MRITALNFTPLQQNGVAGDAFQVPISLRYFVVDFAYANLIPSMMMYPSLIILPLQRVGRYFFQALEFSALS